MMNYKKLVLFMALFVASFASVVLARPVSITVLDLVLEDGTKKSIQVIGVMHLKDLQHRSHIKNFDSEDYDDYFQTMKEFIASQEEWDKPVDFLLEAQTYLREGLNRFMECRLLREYGLSASPTCPFHFMQVDDRSDWMVNMNYYFSCKNNPSLYADPLSMLYTYDRVDCGTIGQFRSYIQNAHARIDDLKSSLPDWLKQSRLISSTEATLRTFSNCYVDFGAPVELINFRQVDNSTRMKDHLSEFDKNPRMNQQIDLYYRKWLGQQRAPFMSLTDTLYSLQIITLYVQDMPHVAFFYELANSQKNHDKSMLMCGDLHAQYIIQGFKECGYKITFQLLEGGERISANVMRECITRFGGWCNECGKRGRKECGGCHHTKYCSRTCQVSGWKGGHRACCKVMQGAIIALEEDN